MLGEVLIILVYNKIEIYICFIVLKVLRFVMVNVMKNRFIKLNEWLDVCYS